MREISIISGRSSKGKDSLLGSLAYLSNSAVIVDCSFEYNVLRKILQSKSQKSRKLPFFRGFSFDEDRCSHCQQCLNICHQHAIGYAEGKIQYYEYRCSHCGSCIRWCPLMVMSLEDQNDISLIVSETNAGPLVFTESLLEPSLMPAMIKALREQAVSLAKARKADTILINGSRGTNDSSYVALAGVDAVMIVVSPTVWAFNDLERDMKLSRLSGVEPLIISNMYGFDSEFDAYFNSFCEEKKLSVAGKIPVDADFRNAVIHNQSMLEYSPDSASSDAIRSIWRNVINQVRHFRS